MTYAVICVMHCDVTVWTLSFSVCICVHELLCVSVCCFISPIEVFSMNKVDYITAGFYTLKRD